MVEFRNSAAGIPVPKLKMARDQTLRFDVVEKIEVCHHLECRWMRGRRARIAIDLTLGLDQSHRHPLARKREGAYRPDRTGPHDNGIMSFAARHTGPQWGD